MTLPRHLLALVIFVIAGAAFAEPARVVVISDLNGSYGSTEYDPRVSNAVDAIIALHPDVVISTGDMVAGQRRPVLSEREVRAMWESFHDTVTIPLADAGIPLAVTPGNHDASAYGGFERERQLYSETWAAHRPALTFVDDDHYPFYYAFDVGPVRFASLDATTVGALPPEQEDWLAQVFSGGGPTRAVFSHLPLWPVAIKREKDVIGDPELEKHFVRLGIDLHLSGHHHAFYPGASGGVAYVAQACLGAGPRALIGTKERSTPGFTLLDIADDGTTTVTALKAPDFTVPVDVRTLPGAIEYGKGHLTRLDLSDIETVLMGTPD